MSASRTKTFFISMLIMDACICIHSIPDNWRYFRESPFILIGEFFFNMVNILWLVAPFFLLYGYLFVDKMHRIEKVDQNVLWILKGMFVLVSSCVYLLFIYLIKYPKPMLNEMLSMLLYLFLSGFTVMIIYEKYSPRWS